MTQKKLGTEDNQNERGNVFFALFGAVAVVGVIGAASMSIMRGPLSTMVEVNKRTQAESQMQLAGRMAIVQSADQAGSGDCDSDGYIEPIRPNSFSAPVPSGTLVNGGSLPNTIGATKTDPWGTEYGYCAWNAGAVDSGGGCAASTPDLIEGSGTDLDDYAIITIVSAGPDRAFTTNCRDYATAGAGSRLAVKPSGADDIIMDFTYSEAQAFAGGLWRIQSGNPDVAEITKDLEVTGGASFSGTSSLDLSGLTGSLLLPDQVASGACSAANDGVVRRDTTTNPPTLQICGDTTGGGVYNWSNVAAGAASLPAIVDGDTEVRVNDTTPEITFDVDGTEELTLDATALNAGSLNVTTTGTLAAANTTVNGTLNATGNADFDADVNVDGTVTITNGAASDPALTVTGDVEAVNVDITGDFILDDVQSIDWGDGTVNISGSSAADTLTLTVAESSFIGNVTMVDLTSTGNANLEVLTVDETITISNASAAATALTVQGDIDVNGDASISGDITDAVDITISGTITGADADFSGQVEADEYIISSAPNTGQDLAALPDCDGVNDKLLWDTTGGWSCGTDGAGGGSGDPNDELQNLDEVLQQGNDAGGRTALDLGGVAIGRNSLSSNDLEVQGTTSFHASGGATVATIFNDNNTTVNPDILFNGSAIIASENDIFINIDSDNNDVDTRLFKVKKNAGTLSGADLFVIEETGQVNIPNTGLAIGSSTISNGTNTDLYLDVTGDVGAIEYCDADGANCFDAASVATLVGGAVTEIDDLTDAYHDITTDFDGDTVDNDDNLALGHEFVNLDATNPGARNTSVGTQALGEITTGDENTALGYLAGSQIQGAQENVFIGESAGRYVTDAGSLGSTIIGAKAMAATNDNQAHRSVVIGRRTGGSQGAYMSVTVGETAGVSRQGVVIGLGAGSGIIDQNNSRSNVLIGMNAGVSLINGDSNIILGSGSDVSAATVSNELNIGGTIFGNLANDQIGIGVADATAIDSTALLELDSTTRGFLMPRMTTAERDAIATLPAVPSTGLQIYNTTTNTVDYYNGTAWVSFASSSGNATALSDADGDTRVLVEENPDEDIVRIEAAGSQHFKVWGASSFPGATVGSGLHVLNPVGNSTVVSIRSSSSGAGSNRLLFGHQWGTTSFGHIGTDGSDKNHSMALSAYGARDIKFSTNSTERMRLDENGNFGIGTPTPNEKLTILDGVFAVREDDDGNDAVRIGAGNATGGIILLKDGVPLVDISSAETGETYFNSGNVVFGNTTGDASARVQIDSTDKGFLPPRIADPNGDITTPATGLIAYDSTDNELQVYDGTSWVSFSGGGSVVIAVDDLTDAFHDITTDFDGDASDNDDNLALGHEFSTLDGTNPGARNTAIGATALDAVTTGDDNVVMGYSAGGNLTGGRQNVFIGNSAGRDNNSNFNTMLGYAAGRDTTGTHNTLVGHNSGINSVNDYNTIIGSQALFRNTTGENNTVIGAEAGQGTSNGSRENNTLIGFRAGYGMEGGANNNILLGHQAGDATTTGSSNILIGYDVDASSATASNEMNIGDVLYGDLTNGRIGIGAPAPDSTLHLANGGSQIRVNGSGNPSYPLVFDDMETANRGSEIRWERSNGSLIAGIRGHRGDSVIPNQLRLFPRAIVGANTYINHSAALEVNSTGGGFLPPRMTTVQRDAINSGTFATGLVVYNSTDNELQVYDGTSWVTFSGGGSVVIAIDDLTDAATDYTGNNMFFGTGVGGSFGVTDIQNVALGVGSMASLNDSAAANNAAFGYQSLNALLSGQNNVGLGRRALYRTTIGNSNVAVGTSSLINNLDGGNNIALGTNTLAANVSGNTNVAIGTNTLNNYTGNNNVAIGSSTLRENISGADNLAIGTNTARFTTGANNVVLGTQSSYVNTTGETNTVVGSYAGGANNSNTQGDTDANTVLGYRAGYSFTGGAAGLGANNNVLLGYQAGDAITLGDNNIMIGYDVDASSATASNELNIGDVLFGDLSTGNIGIGTGATTPTATLDIDTFLKADSDDLINISEDGNTIFRVTARDGGSVAHGPSRDFSVCAIGGNCLGIDNQGLAARDHLGIRISAREDEGGANNAISLVNDVLLPSGVPLLKVGIGTNAATAEYLRVDSTGGIGIGTGAENNSSAIMEVSSTSRGFLPPRIADPAGDIATPATGLIAYDSTDNELQVYDGTSWVIFSGGGAAAIAIDDLTDGAADTTNVFLGDTSGGSFGVDNSSNTAVGINALSSLTNATGSGFGGDNNVAVGYGALENNTSARGNIGVGIGAGGALTTGGGNVAIGEYALVSTSIGYSNIAIGGLAMQSFNTGDFQNVVIGGAAFNAATGGGNNAVVGYGALGNGTGSIGDTAALGAFALRNATGSRNTALGAFAGDAVTSGTNNIIIGYNAASNLDTKSDVIAIGKDALLSYQNLGNGSPFAIGTNTLDSYVGQAGRFAPTAVGDNVFTNMTTGGWNTGVGRYVGTTITTGIGNTFIGDAVSQFGTNGSDNTAVGSNAMYNAGGDGNTAIGRGALYGSGGVGQTTTRNTALGQSAGGSISGGTNNLFLGYQAGDLTTSGSSNIMIGYDVDASSATASSELNIGNLVYGDLSVAGGNLRNIGIGVSDVTAIDNSAILQTDSTSQGFLPPRVADPAGNIATPATGLIAYDSTDNELQVYDGTSWVTFSGGSGTAAAGSDREIQFNNSGNLGATAAYAYNAVGDLELYGGGNTVGSKADFDIFRYRGTDQTSPAAVQDGDNLGFLRFNAYDGSGYIGTARIGAIVNDDNITANDVETDLVIYSGSDGSPVETARFYGDSRAFVVGEDLADMEAFLRAGSGSGLIGVTGVNPDIDAFAFGDTDKGDLTFTKAQGDAATPTAIVDGNEIGAIRWAGIAANGNERRRASILGVVNGTVAGNDIPIDILFKTTDSDDDEGVERMRIAADGLTTFSSGVQANSTVTVNDDLNVGGADLYVNAFDGLVGIGGAPTDASAKLEVISTSQGFLPPRVADPAGDIATPATGLIAYDSTDNELQVYDGTSWVVFSGGGAAAIGIDDLTDAIHNTTTTFNLFLGDGSGIAATGGTNVGVGQDALSQLTSGNSNVAVGVGAMQGGETMSYNVSVGSDAGRNITGDYNVAVGSEAGSGVASTTTAADSVFVGYQAGTAITTGNDNTLVGYQAAASLTTGINNVVMGHGALDTATDLGYVVAIGKDAARSATTIVGIAGTIVGTESANGVTDISNVTTLGTNTLFSASADRITGSTAIGTASLFSSGLTGNARGNTGVGNFTAGWMAEGGQNVFIGKDAGVGLGGGAQAWNGSENTIIGEGSGAALTLGPSNSNVFLGANTAATLAAGSNNILIGNNTDVSGATASNEMNIGDVLFGDLANGRIGIGTRAPSELLTITGADGTARRVSLTNAAGDARIRLSVDSFNNGVIQMRNTSNDLRFVASNTNAFFNNSSGLMIGSTNLPDGSAELQVDATDRGFLPPRVADPAGDITTPATGLIAYDSTDNELQVYDGTSWVAFSGGGAAAIAINDLTDAYKDFVTNNNLFMGHLGASLTSAGTPGTNNVVIGRTTGTSMEDASRNTLLGDSAGAGITDGDDNVIIGYSAGNSLTTDYRNVIIGNYAGSGSGIHNTFVGERAGRDTVGSGNTFIGRAAGQGHSSGDGNVILGDQLEGAIFDTGSNNILIGASVDTSAATASNELNIGNMIFGDLANGEVGIGVTSPDNILDIAGDIANGEFLVSLETNGVNGAEFMHMVGTGSNSSMKFIQNANGSGAMYLYNGTGAANETVRISADNGGRIGIGTNIPDVALDVVGDIEYTGTITDVSDRRLKTDITKLSTNEIIEKLAKIDTYSFKMKDDEKGRVELGVMAQELEVLFPELVHTAKDEMGTKSVNYMGLIAPMIEASKALKNENDTLKAEMAEMKSQQTQILAALTDMKEDVAGIKVHTNYGIQKAAYENWPMMLIMMMFGGAFVFFASGLRRKS